MDTPETVEVTQLYCAQSGGAPGEPSTTHHLRPKGEDMVCIYCGGTDRYIRWKHAKANAESTR